MRNTAISNQRSAIRNGQSVIGGLKPQCSMLDAHRSISVKPLRGFTLIETLVAISVLLVSLAGPLSIAAQALRSAYSARDQVTAFYLAQEAIEYVRSYRDENYLAPPPVNWLKGINTCLGASCTVDFRNFTHQVCDSGGCSPLLIGSDGLYNTKSGDLSMFTRTLTLSAVPGNPDEVLVDVTVTWTSAGLNRTFNLTEHIFDWL